MRPPGSFRIPRRVRHERPRRLVAGASLDACLESLAHDEMRIQRIVDSIREQVSDCEEEQSLRIRQVFQTPREIYRVELEVPAMNYLRTTLLDREALEELLESEAVRDALERPVGS